jgi:hypothetical protein
VERPALTLSTTTVVEVLWPGERLARRAAAAARRARSRYEATIGAHRGWDRRRCVVEHRLPGAAAHVLDQLCRDGDIRSADAHLAFHGDVGALTYDAVDHEYRVPSRLRLRWSWPALRVRLAVGELGPDRCVLRLRSASRRLRYPARYFEAAHTTLTALERSLSAGVDEFELTRR